MLFNPKKYASDYPCEKSKEIMKKTIDFFERKGKQRIKADDQWCVWYDDFIQFLKDNKIFATLLTPSKYGDADCRWDTWRNCEMNEILAFYSLSYWYAWQVSILGLGPVWMSKNEEMKKKTAQHLQYGRIFAFGLSEREHGADIYSTDMMLKPQTGGPYLAEGDKYYIGNANQAVIVSTFGKIAGTGEFVFFPVDSHNEKFELVRNVVASQMYVAQYNLHDYPIKEEEILEKGQEAWDASLNTVNVGKFNLGWATIGICTHSFYEAINHASHRILFGKAVTEFSQVKQLFVDSYTRLVAMRLFALRAIDYFRSASAEDRRYLLYNPMVKMKVTMQGEEVINLLWDVIAAKGFEKDTYFEMATRHIRALPKLEGTAHVNMALIIKFMANYFFNPGKFPEIPKRNDVADDTFFWEQGADEGPEQDPVPRLQAGLRRLRPAQPEHLQGADQALQGLPGHGDTHPRAAEGHRLPADPGRAVHLCGLRAAHPGEREDQQRGQGPARPDLRLHGARLLEVRPAALQQAEQHREADGAVHEDDPQARRRRGALRKGPEQLRVCAEGYVRNEP